MFFKSVASAALMATATLGARVPTVIKPFGCGTEEPSRAHVQISQALAVQEAEMKASGNFSIAATINVKVYVHVVAASTSNADGYISVSLSPLINFISSL